MVNDSQQQFIALIEELYKNPEQVGAVLESAGITSADITPNADYNDMVTRLETAMDEAEIDYSNVEVSQNVVDTPITDSNVDSDTSSYANGPLPGTLGYEVLQNQKFTSYNGNYGGNTIFYNEGYTDLARECINKFNGEFCEHLEDVKNVDKYFDSLPEPYKKAAPNPRFSSLAPDISAIDVAYKNCLGNIDAVVAAINDYSNGGDIAPTSTETLDKFLVPMDNPAGGGAGGGVGGGSGAGSGGRPITAPVPADDNPNLQLEDPNISGGTTMETPILPSNTDAKLLNYGNASSAALGGVGLGAVSGDSSNALDDLGTSLFSGSDSRLVVPSFGTTVGKMDGIKSSGVVGVAGAAGAVIAASAAVGGKVYYDKKKESNEADEKEISEDSNELELDDESHDAELEKAKTNSDEIAFGLNGVAFKESLLNIEGGDDSE